MTEVFDFSKITFKRSKLKQLRESRRLTLKQLSVLSGISLTRLTQLEKETENLSQQHLQSLMAIFDCSSGDILYTNIH